MDDKELLEKRKYIEELSDKALNHLDGTEGYEQDVEKAFQEFLECALYYEEDPECEDAQVCLHDVGNCYFNGVGVERNYAEALKWLTKAANYPYNETALITLAEMYEQGLGVEINYDKAAEYYKKYHKLFPYFETAEAIYNLYENGLLSDLSEKEEWRIEYERCLRRRLQRP